MALFGPSWKDKSDDTIRYKVREMRSLLPVQHYQVESAVTSDIQRWDVFAAVGAVSTIINLMT
jgi:hypothetical protein